MTGHLEKQMFHITITQPVELFPEGWESDDMLHKLCIKLDEMGLLEHRMVEEMGKTGANPHFHIIASGHGKDKQPNHVKRSLEATISGQCRKTRSDWPRHLKNHFIVVKASKTRELQNIWVNYGNKEEGKRHTCGFKETYLQQAARDAEKARIISENSAKKTKFMSDRSMMEEMTRFMVEESPHEQDFDKLCVLMQMAGWNLIYVRRRKYLRALWRMRVNLDGGEMYLAQCEDEIAPHLRKTFSHNP